MTNKNLSAPFLSWQRFQVILPHCGLIFTSQSKKYTHSTYIIKDEFFKVFSVVIYVYLQSTSYYYLEIIHSQDGADGRREQNKNIMNPARAFVGAEV